MRQGFRKGLSLLLAGILSLAFIFAWPATAAADATGDVSGSTAATTTFYVYANGSGSGYIRLFATKGSAYVADYDYYGNFKGYKAEDAYGFFRVQVTKSGYEKTYIWAPSASMSTYGVETSQSLVVVFPVNGDYKVVVTPLTAQEINGTYWVQNRFQYWTKDATWIVNKAVNCQCTPGSGGGSQPPAGNYQVTVNCLDQNGAFIQSYNETVQSSKTIYPRSVNGYTAITSSGYYITVNNGVCTPSSVSFYYNKAAAATGTVTVYCYDSNNTYIRTYTETISGSKTIYPQAISGYTALSTSGQYITFSNGVCSPAAVTFKYQKNQTSGTVTVYCYDTSNTYLRAYTETITASKTIYPQAISGYNTTSTSGQYITFNNGTCSPASVTFYYQKYATSATVTVTCRDTSGAYLNSYTETVTASTTIYPKAISGYNVASGGQYIAFNNGVASPSSVEFKYQKIQNPATLNINCYDENGNYIRSYTETITASKMVYPQAISGYNISSSGQNVTYSDGTCNPASLNFTYTKIPTPASVTIRCIDNNGNIIRTTTESITANKTISPPSISGYTALSSSQQVTYSNGTASPSQIDFQYQIGSSVKPGTNPRASYPASWDTQFKPGTATAHDGSNAVRIERLPYVYDEDPTTSLNWMIWNSEMGDNIPELTAYFNGDTISSIGIHNGRATSSKSYNRFARPKELTLKIHDNNGNTSTVVLAVMDKYSQDWQEISLGATYTNVSYVEIFVSGIKYGDGSGDASDKNTCHIADIIFFK